MNFDFDNKKKTLTFIFSSVIIFLLVFILINVSAVSGFISGLLSTLAPIIVGASIAYLLNPLLKLYEYRILKKLKKKNIRRILSLILTFVSVIVVIALFLVLIIPQIIKSIVDLAGKLDIYIDNTIGLAQSLIAKLDQYPEIAKYVNKEELASFLSQFFSGSQNLVSTILTYVKDFGISLFVGVKNLLVGLFISIYILSSKESLHAGVRKITAAIFKEHTRTRLLRYTRIANRTFGNYFVGVLVDACIVGLVSFIIFTIFNIPYAPLVATIVGVTNIIPIFGPFLGAIPSAFIIFIANPSKALLFIILIIVIQQIDGNIIAPKILGNSTGISSLGVIVAIVIMGDLFGIIGMIVGVPVFAMIIMVVNEIIETKLKDKGLATSTDDYYPAYSLVDPHEHHEKFGERLFRSLFGGLIDLIKKIVKKIKERKKTNGDAEADPQNEEEKKEKEEKEDNE